MRAFSRSISPGTRSRRACRRVVGWQGRGRRRRCTLPRRRGRWQTLGSSLDSQHTQAHAVYPRPLRGNAGSQHCAGHSPPVRTGTHAQGSAQQQYVEGIPDAVW